MWVEHVVRGSTAHGVGGFCFFFNETATTGVYPLSLHAALPFSAWIQQPYDHGLVAHLTLVDDRPNERDPDRTLGVLVVTGRYAGFVERCTSDSRDTLETQLEAADGNLDEMRTILDCEASYGVRAQAGAPYVIRHSNFPFREGCELDVPQMDRRILERRETLPARRDGAVWRVESWFFSSPSSAT